MRGTLIKLVAFVVASFVCLAWLGDEIGQLRGPAGAFHKTYGLKASFTDLKQKLDRKLPRTEPT